MSTTQEIRAEVQALREQVREKLLTAAEKSYEGVSKFFPKQDGDKLGAIGSANVRWEMLKAGFTHEENTAIQSKLTALTENKLPWPASKEEWVKFVDEKYLGSVTNETHRYTLGLKLRAYKRRMYEPLLNAHEKASFSIGKRIRAIHEQAPDQIDATIKDIAMSTGVQPEMVWRVATGGTKVTGGILKKMDSVVRAIEKDFLDAEDGVNG